MSATASFRDPAPRRIREALWILLFPLACVWAAAASGRRRVWRWRERYRSRLPVICVGNLHSGGSGKTPLVLGIARRWESRRPVIVSRGYRGREGARPAWVDPQRGDGAARFGDEPWMMATLHGFPVVVGRRRADALRLAESRGDFGLAILDDGFQHLPVSARLNVIAIGADRRLEDAYCLPLGELREPLGALSEAHAVVLVQGATEDRAGEWRQYLAAKFPSLPVFSATRRWDLGAESVTGAVGAFCGIAAPSRFFDDVSAYISAPVFFRAFGDHHAYSDADIDELIRLRRHWDLAGLVTTEKDWAKVGARFRARGVRVWVPRIHYELPAPFWYFLQDCLELA